MIAIIGNQWHLQTVSAKRLPEICAKKSDQQKPAKLTGFFLIKTRISENNPIMVIYSTGVDALPLEPENPIRKQAIGARIGLKIMHLMNQVKLPGFWLCLTYFRPPVHAHTPGVFDRTGVHVHPTGAHFEEIWKSKPANCPEQGFFRSLQTMFFPYGYR